MSHPHQGQSLQNFNASRQLRTVERDLQVTDRAMEAAGRATGPRSARDQRRLGRVRCVQAGLLRAAAARRPALDADRVDAQRLDVLAVGVALAGAEVGAELAGELLPEGVEPGHVVGVVEDEQALVVVQEDAHLVQLVPDVEPRPGLGAGAVLVAVVHDDAVEAAARLDLDAALAARGLVRQPDHPLGLLCHHHLPVVDTTAEGLGAQHRHLHVKALWRVLQGLWVQVPVGHDGAVIRQDQALVGSARV